MDDDNDFFGSPPAMNAPPPPNDDDDDGVPAPSNDDFGGYENIGDVDFAMAANGSGDNDLEDDDDDDEDDEHGQMPSELIDETPADAEDLMMGSGEASGAGGPIVLGGPSGGGEALTNGKDRNNAFTNNDSGAIVPQESPVAKFNQEFQETLMKRKDHENTVRAAAVENAREELEVFQQQREAKREARMSKNRADEQQKLEDLEADLENDNSWQRVVKMVELQQDTVEGTQDKTRMIDILILMKNDAERAVALA